jgi:hypothetical protein
MRIPSIPDGLTIATLFTLITDPSAQLIDEDCLEKAICMADFFLDHRKLADTLKIERTPEMRILDRLAMWIRQSRDVGDVNQHVSIPIRGDGSLHQSMKQLENALYNLERWGWVEIAEDRIYPRADLLSLRW